VLLILLPPSSTISCPCSRAPAVIADHAALFGLLGYDAAVVISLVMELGTPQAVLLLTVTVVLLPVALMAALKNRLSLSSICTKLAAIILTPICWSCARGASAS